LIADTIGGWSFDGSTLRLEFPVSRLDALKPGDAASGRAVPVCRLVLTTAAAVELIRASGQILCRPACCGRATAMRHRPGS
jgi:hypothetical protein